MGRDSILWVDSGREFQRRGAERLKALSPIGDKRAGGAESSEEEEDRRERERERVRLEELREKRRSEIMEGLESEEKNLKVYAV